jgi:D-galactarolactone cycloisomerase
MKISSVRAIPLSIPLRRAMPASAWAAGLAKQILVEVVTDEGIVGWGEAFAYGAPLAVVDVIQNSLEPMLLGADPTQIEPLVETMERSMMIWGRRGLGMFALSGVEIALWDILGKARGVPVHQLLGGGILPRLRAYSSLLRFDRPEDAADASQQAVAQGFTAIKLHQIDFASVVAARRAVGDGIDLMLDVNCPWSPDEAIRRGREFEECRLTWFEEPVWPPEDYPGLARVASALSTSIAAGENESTAEGFRALIAARAADILQPSVTKVGGLLHAKRISALAQGADLPVVPHSFYLGPGMAATLHLAAAIPRCPYVELASYELEAPLLDPPPRASGGWMNVPAGPGLGFEINRDAVKRFPYGDAGKKLFSTS